MIAQIILFLLFMGAEKGVNRIAGRPLMNGARCYLIAAAILFVVGMMVQAFAAPMSDDPRVQAEVFGYVLGSMCGSFIFPVGAAIHYSNKFAQAQEAAPKEPSR